MTKRFRIAMKLIITLSAGLLLLSTAIAEVITFDDLPDRDDCQSQVPPGYAGITWGSNSDKIDSKGANSIQWIYRSYNSYKALLPVPHSSPNFVFNLYGANDLWFSFPAPVTFNGAWFSYFNKPNSAVAVRFRDNQGNVSSWLKLSDTPQFLTANFSGALTIYVETSGQNRVGQNGAEWYIMDDVTYNEPLTQGIAMSGAQ